MFAPCLRWAPAPGGHKTRAGGSIQVVTQHQQEGLAADGLFRAVNGMAKTFLGRLDDKIHAAPDFQNPLRVFLERTRQLIVVFDGHLSIEECAELIQVVFLCDDNQIRGVFGQGTRIFTGFDAKPDANQELNLRRTLEPACEVALGAGIQQCIAQSRDVGQQELLDRSFPHRGDCTRFAGRL